MKNGIKKAVPLKPGQLCPRYNLDAAALDRLSEAGDSADLIGQDRAINAIRFSARIADNGFNVFVMGKPGHGRHQTVGDILAKESSGLPCPGDWIYTYNFENPDKPVAIELPPGRAIPLKKAMESMVDDLATGIPALFESDDYQNRRRSVEQAFGERHEKAFAALMEDANKKELTLLRTPMGFVVAATKDGKPLTPDQFRLLPETEQEAIDAAIAETQTQLEEVLRQIPKNEKDRRRAVEALNAEVAKDGVDDSINQLLEEFSEIEALQRYLKAVRQDLIENAELFLDTSQSAQAGAFPVATTRRYEEPQFKRYLINVVIHNECENETGAPVVTENLPTLGNLVGRIEHISHMGTLVTDFTMIKPGALHKANGGYLVLDIRQVLAEPFAWDALKRCMQTGQISIISAEQRFNLFSTSSLEPDPIPLNVRVALIGERLFYYLLMAYDPDFASLFKVQADFNDDVQVSETTIGKYVAQVRELAEKGNRRSLDVSAINKLLVESNREVGDIEKLSLNLEKVRDVLTEADFWAAEKGSKRITAKHIEHAFMEAEARASRPMERVQEAITRETILIDTEGGVVGQINALSVHQIGNFRFGRPSRVTARVRMGKGTFIDIEREVELGGPLHSKGVLILSGYLATHFALDVPLSMWASIVFEQSYGGVDGDSASAAELLCLLSALSGVPIDQSFAVTGSVNQHGQVQAIGGVNEKIEGFFDVCNERGLTGNQGVLIPASNVDNLALRSRVTDAVKSRKFSITPINTIDQGIEVLTSTAAGTRGTSGRYPVHSVNGLVEARLRDFASGLRKFSKGSGQQGPDEDGDPS